MPKILIPFALILAGICGCAMLGSWKAIPPPGGCDQCHTKQISANWEAAIVPARITSETGTEPWQSPESVVPEEPSPLEEKKLTEQRCFRCHNAPDLKHRKYRGRYHH